MKQRCPDLPLPPAPLGGFQGVSRPGPRNPVAHEPPLVPACRRAPLPGYTGNRSAGNGEPLAHSLESTSYRRDSVDASSHRTRGKVIDLVFGLSDFLNLGF